MVLAVKGVLFFRAFQGELQGFIWSFIIRPKTYVLRFTERREWVFVEMIEGCIKATSKRCFVRCFLLFSFSVAFELPWSVCAKDLLPTSLIS